ncbi:unnamed protein product [Ectocarpus sp. 6 AP-2014]
MDSLTARLTSRSGLNPVDPTLPPVHNVRMVYLKEPYGEAEEALHEARVALTVFETSGNDVDRNTLHKAMANLAGKEQDYLANRYFCRDKTVLKGWKEEGKQAQFTRAVAELKKGADDRVLKTPPRYRMSLRAARSCANAMDVLFYMNQNSYETDGTTRRTNMPRFATRLAAIQKLVDEVREIHQHMKTAGSSLFGEVVASLKDAETALRLAAMITRNEWDLPFELRYLGK